MSLPPSQLRFTIEEYLVREREAEERHEYLDGGIYAMAGESPQHADISVNLVAELRTQLKGRPCRVWTKDSKVRCGPVFSQQRARKGLFAYPDLLVVCDEPQFLDEQQDVLLNPTVIIEVLSPSTEKSDREKFRRYRTHLPSLRDYLLVSQDCPLLEHFARRPDGQWLYSVVSELTGSLALASIDCRLALAEVYDRVTFPALDEPEPTSARQAVTNTKRRAKKAGKAITRKSEK